MTTDEKPADGSLLKSWLPLGAVATIIGAIAAPLVVWGHTAEKIDAQEKAIGRHDTKLEEHSKTLGEHATALELLKRDHEYEVEALRRLEDRLGTTPAK